MTILLLSTSAAVAAADESQTADGAAVWVQMWSAGHVQPALWLAGQAGGWSVPLPFAVADACTARLTDITPEPLPRTDHVEALAPGQDGLMLPRPRYIGSHTYRISFQCGRVRPTALVVHLTPSPEELALWQGQSALGAGSKLATR